MKVSQVQFDEVVTSAQVRFGATEVQAIRLAKSMVADMGKLPDQPVSARFKSTEKKGLSSIRFSVAALKGSSLDGIDGFSRHTPSIKLCELLQDIEAVCDKNIGLSIGSRVELTRDLHEWLFVGPVAAVAAKPEAPKAPESQGDKAPPLPAPEVKPEAPATAKVANEAPKAPIASAPAAKNGKPELQKA